MQTRKPNAGFWFSLLAVALWFAAGTIAQAQADHIMGLWHFDQINTNLTTTTPDSSGHNNTGTLNGTVGLVSGKWDHALGFDGTSGYVDVPDATSLDIPGSLTVEAWVYPTVIPSRYMTIISKENSSQPFNVNYNLHITGDAHLRFAVTFNDSVTADPALVGASECSPGGCTLTGVGTITPGVWHHIAAVYDETAKSVTLYLDGVLDGASDFETDGQPTTNAQDVFIGRRHYTSLPNFFIGKIDEVRIWDRALTPEEILSSAQAGLRALWHFDNNLADSSGYGNIGTNHGATFADGPFANFNDGAAFDGTDQFISVEHSPTLDMTSAYTVEGWVYLSSAVPDNSYIPIAVRGDASTGDNDIEIYCQIATYNRDLTVVHNRDNGGIFNYAYFPAPPLNKWFHLAVVFNGTTVQAYYDGVLQTPSDGSPGSGSLAQPLATGKGWLFGKATLGTYGTYYLKGSEDEFHIWARALGEAEVEFLSGNGTDFAGVPPAAPLFIPAIWKEKFGTGAVYGSDWHVGTTNPATVLQMVVPDNPDVTIEPNDDLGVIQTPKPSSDATLNGFVLGNGNLDALINGEQGDHNKTLHLSTTLTDDVVLKSVWNPGH